MNLKKEALLEKELVLEEISNLSEKLRKQARDGRKGTLELAEKINDFRAKTTELSRKMLATVAEVAMYQARAIELEQRKHIYTDVDKKYTAQKSQTIPHLFNIQGIMKFSRNISEDIRKSTCIKDKVKGKMSEKKSRQKRRKIGN